MAGGDVRSVIPVTFLVPESSQAPMEIELRHQALKMVVVNREAVSALAPFWDRRGVYFLFGHAPSADHYTAYVGKASGGLISRISNHVRSRGEPWYRALLVASAATNDLDSAAIGWLEGRLYDLLDSAPAALLTNRNRPRDESLPEYDREVLEQFVAPIAAVLRALGCSPDTPDQAPPEPSRRTRSTIEGSLADLISGGFVHVGTRLRSVRASPEAVATVLEGGRLQVGSNSFDAPSSAAEHVLGHKTNGWRFWGVPSGSGTLTPLITLRDRLHLEGPRRGQHSDVPEEATGGPAKAALRANAHRVSHATRLVDLIASRIIPPNGELTSHLRGGGHCAEYRQDGSVDYGGATFNSPSSAGQAAIGGKVNGWAFWYVELEGRLVPLSELRTRYEDVA